MKKLTLSVAIAAAMGLSACGGGGGGSSSSAASGATVNGAASKGIVVGGKVSAYLFDSTGSPETTAIATTTTDANGEYSLNIPSTHNGKPLFIVVDDNDGNATMKCDLTNGCDKDGDPATTDDITPFGEVFDLDSGDLEMSAVLPESTATVSINVTLLTTVAAGLAKNAISAGAVTDFNIKEAVNNANSQVSERFGLTGHITKQPVIDLTNSAKVAVSASNKEGLKYAALNAAIVSAVQADAAKKMGQAIKDFSDDYVANGLSTKAVSSSKTDLSEILAAASAVINKVKTKVSADLGAEDASLAELTTLGGTIDDDQTVADASTPSDSGNQGTPSPTANATKLAQVKAFVEELRELGTVMGNSMVGSGDSAQSIESIADNFEAQLSAADLASSDDVGYSLEAMAEALGAMSMVYENNFDIETGALITPSEDNDATITELPATVVHEGVSVSVAQVNGVIVLSVEENIVVTDDEQVEHTVAVDISGTVTNLTFDETKILDYDEYNEETGVNTWGDKGSGTGAADISFMGTASTGTAKISLLDGSGAKANLVFSFEGEGTNSYESGMYEDFADFTVTGFDLGLNVKIEQTSVSETQTGGLMVFTGSLDAEVSSLRVIEDTSDTWGNDWSDESWSWYDTEDSDTSLRLGTVSLVLAGNFANDVDSFDARFSIDGNGKNINYREVYSFSSEGSSQGSSYSESSESFGETESSYSDVTVKLNFTADLAGISADGAEEVDFSFEAKRTGFDDGEVSVSLKYPGRMIDIVADASAVDSDNSAKGKLTLSNNDGVQILVTGDESKAEGEDVTLEIRMDTNEDGKIDSSDFLFAWYEVRNGVDLLVFADDKDADNIEFESFF